MKDIGFSPADILLPVESISMERWAVVACDQFTSEKEYWEEADRIAGDAPSTLRMILPECYLEDDDREDRIRKIEKCMDDYLEGGIFRTFPDSYVLVRRDTESGKIGSVAQKVKSTPGATVVLTGYADAQTGSAKRNMYLSQKRAEAVASALEEAGVDGSRIKVDYKGDTVAPYGSPEENRVVICIVGWEE